MEKRNYGKFEVSFYENKFGRHFAKVKETSVNLEGRLVLDIPLSASGGKNKALKKIMRNLRNKGYTQIHLSGEITY